MSYIYVKMLRLVIKINDTFLWLSPAKYALCAHLKSYDHQKTSHGFPDVLAFKILYLQGKLNTVIIICDFVILFSIDRITTF